MGEKKYLGWCHPPPALAQPHHLLTVPPSCSTGCFAAAEGQQLDTLHQYIADVQIKQQHKQGVGSKYDLSAMAESH